MELLYMPKERNELSDYVFSHWFPMRRSSQESRVVKEVWRGEAQPNGDVM